MTAFEPLDDRARRAVLGQYAALVVALAGATVAVVGVLATEVDDSLGDLSGALDAWVWLATLPLVIAWAVTNLRWMASAVRNVAHLTGAPGTRTPRWALWSWFVPGVWWVVPKLVVNELWRSGDRRRGGPVGRVVHVWWGVWLLGWVLSIVSNVLWWPIAEGERPASAAPYVADLLAWIIAIASVLLSVVVIRRITARQEAGARAASEAT